VDPKAYMPLFS